MQDVQQKAAAPPHPHQPSSSLRHRSLLKDWIMLIKAHRKSFRRKGGSSTFNWKLWLKPNQRFRPITAELRFCWGRFGSRSGSGTQHFHSRIRSRQAFYDGLLI
ncbi:hypothetical protein CCH79_00017841 [Gambusia affinis]|uniref:Uncharacterized protein n=1 Tax=Gambusia affinis TaxID=33528 RepID=A0A315UZA1_GAMAF|nr:hypothetical protein CCH79_00017841 [Gambusia affinis]